MAKNHNLEIDINGIDALSNFRFKSSNHLFYKSLLTQEMLKKGFLAATAFYTSTAHSSDILKDYFEALDSTFELISTVDNGKKDIKDLLRGKPCHDGFKRLN